MHERRVADEHGKGRIHELGRDSGPDHASRWRRPVSSDCCREAGWFGYHAGERYDLWVAAERRLLPALEETPEDALVIADGFSCRGQIRQLGGRRPLHVAQVVQRALRESGRTGPEKDAVPEASGGRRSVAVAAGLAAGLGVAGWAWAQHG